VRAYQFQIRRYAVARVDSLLVRLQEHDTWQEGTGVA
jgi:hypothetical protein